MNWWQCCLPLLKLIRLDSSDFIIQAAILYVTLSIEIESVVGPSKVKAAASPVTVVAQKKATTGFSLPDDRGIKSTTFFV